MDKAPLQGRARCCFRTQRQGVSVLAQAGQGVPVWLLLGQRAPRKQPPSPTPPTAVAPAHLVNRTLQMLHS